jgi:glycosyltransferase involved in cell wall biosynthesis
MKADRTAGNVGIAVVIPCYREKAHILDVLARIGREVAAIYIVDDCCPEHTGDVVATECRDDRVRIIRLTANLGVGGAVLAGARRALMDGHRIVVKIDGDGQMDPKLIRRFVRPIEEGAADVTKGNRFYDLDNVRSMPLVRLFGNAALSFLTKLSSGYWSIFDPTNGFIAWDSRILSAVPMEKLASRYFFESDMLFRIGLLRAKVLDIPMVATYGSEVSRLNPGKQLFPFLFGNAHNFLKRIFYNYFLRDFNIGSIEITFGLALCVFGLVYGILHWGINEPATAGTVMVAALPLLTGILLLISFINYDVQQTPREPIANRLPDIGSNSNDGFIAPPIDDFSKVGHVAPIDI